MLTGQSVDFWCNDADHLSLPPDAIYHTNEVCPRCVRFPLDVNQFLSAVAQNLPETKYELVKRHFRLRVQPDSRILGSGGDNVATVST